MLQNLRLMHKKFITFLYTNTVWNVKIKNLPPFTLAPSPKMKYLSITLITYERAIWGKEQNSDGRNQRTVK